MLKNNESRFLILVFILSRFGILLRQLDYTVLAILLWILFFLQKKSMESTCSLVNYIFFQYTETEVSLEHWKTLKSSIFS